uniref:Homeodomain-only protein n=1 Tax=Equus asinus TaxID=9793 RepID=A0A9L0IEP2_EQUAS
MSAETASGPTEDQVEILEYNFNKVNKHPDPTTLCLIAAEAGLSEEETQVSDPRSEMWHLESNPQREDFAKGSLLPLALDDFSLLPPHYKEMVQ